MSPYDENDDETYGPSPFAHYDEDTDEWVEPGEEEEDDDSFNDEEADDRDDS